MTLSLQNIVAHCHEKSDYSDLIKIIPYAQIIGLECQRFGDDVIFKLPPKETNLGNPILPAIHGGVIGGFMELSASLYLVMFQPDVMKLPKIIDFSIDYLRAGLNRETFVECKLTRKGNRVANVSVSAWQKSRKEPIATARAHFLF
jgi:acyl-coenzyme A thioesterase PaaI-like protein